MFSVSRNKNENYMKEKYFQNIVNNKSYCISQCNILHLYLGSYVVCNHFYSYYCKFIFSFRIKNNYNNYNV